MRTLVVGVGNVDRGDDGVGPLVARLLCDALATDTCASVAPGVDAGASVAEAPDAGAHTGSGGVEVVVWTGDPLALLDAWAGVDRLVLVDAVASGAEPGTCRRFGDDAPFRSDAHASTHGFGVGDALALARSLARLPRSVEIWGIEGADFSPGATMTPTVARAADALAARLAGDLGRS